MPNEKRAAKPIRSPFCFQERSKGPNTEAYFFFGFLFAFLNISLS